MHNNPQKFTKGPHEIIVKEGLKKRGRTKRWANILNSVKKDALVAGQKYVDNNKSSQLKKRV